MSLLHKNKSKSAKSSSGVAQKRRVFRRTRSNSLDKERLVSLINSMGDGVIAVDPRLCVVVYNGAALNILDSNTSMQGKRLGKLVDLRDKDNQPVDIEELITKSGSGGSYRDYSIGYGDGSKAHLYVSIAPVRLGYGQKGGEGYVILLRDITREKSLEDERDEFISVVSHELRTPIAIAEGNIGNALFIAEKTGDIEQVKTALQSAHDQTTFLAEMINDLATLSRAERGKLVYEPESITISELLRDLEDDYTPEAAKKKLTLTIQKPSKDLALLSSKLYVREILQNFITNAIKYTQKGTVEVSAKKSSRGVRFVVKDSGIGISKTDREKIFDKFFRSEDFHTRETNGTGLGLYVTMKLARLIHADISVDSELGKGSTFTIEIPDLSTV